LAGIVLVAVNPAEQFGKANDSERKSEIGTILSAIYQYQTSPTARGALPQCTVNSVVQAIPECDDNYTTTFPTDANGDFDGAIELGTAITSYDCSTTLIPSYLREIPIDPSGTPSYTAANSGYWVCQDTTSGPVVRVYVISEGVEVFTDDGGCNLDISDDSPDGGVLPVMCVSG
ncbi:hypothetical protein JXD20_00390, partial [Candidatus Peregrinibacteria bacterium]|nr:hypothetical protein [Candidatus Peregrinibacteria bacterium]